MTVMAINCNKKKDMFYKFFILTSALHMAQSIYPGLKIFN